MIKIRKSEDRGHANHGWLDSYHTFSFADYYDPENMGFRNLRVINQDTIDAGMGFGTHSHNNMEIISYVVEGALEHKDSMGNGTVMMPGEVQRMSAGTGVSHSEFNHLKDAKTRFLQIWILPEKKNIQPGYAQKNFFQTDKQGKLKLVVSPDGRDGSISLNQDVNLYATVLDKAEEISLNLTEGRHAWVQIVRGSVKLNNEYTLGFGDGAAISEEAGLQLTGIDNAEVLVFDLN